ncbi:Fis family transcriptional regulator [Spiribacter salinus M19-40]|jgi:two-component system nitrogen regulation response regulator GlnG|uniref:DNA-binding transcriptional regulator NtrC n=1 Tax=Spiribacter salinus M19-40 TaxID=1260251 RepID=R4VHL9_9GAMM|nr:nitrogen regulation protein NR(I) [Spiribacter salinus]AGM40112.1 Fis family transcriptional regulator [Spiribacter salinus M19-40]MBY5268656.1 nitrogen regulation protein NR(I) [Spiribacter salinus]MDR9455189.1 nitrogen regulation protein NR(I) [Spiribacter sp.]
MAETTSVWIVDDDRSIRWVLKKALERAGMAAVDFETGEEALAALERETPDVLITDIRMPRLDGLTLMQRFHAQNPAMPVIVITAHSDLDAAVSAYEGGAFEYLPKPFDVEEAVELVRRAAAAAQSSAPPEARREDLPEIIGEAPAMQEVFRAIGRLSRSNITVLINGESGTGKELVAGSLHRHSPRAEKPFIALNMAAIPRDLMESELFGHEKGAFTGAHQVRRGRFEQADGGTLFLDEIGDMPAELQTRLLRVLADGEFYRVGAHTPMRVDVRIIAATHQNLEHLVEEGRFREDLFHRLNVIRIHCPALRERQADIPALADHFLQRAARELNVEPKQLTPDVQQRFRQLPWPGNVRELENTCRWLTVMASGRDVQMDDLPQEIAHAQPEEESAVDWESALARWADHKAAGQSVGALSEAQERLERILIEAALRRTGGRRQDAARLLGWGRNTLTRKIRDLQMQV